MPNTEAQSNVADRIASEYADQVRATPGLGPDGNRLSLACPDGRHVVIGPDGEIWADSRDRGVGSQAVLKALGRDLSRGYDQSCDALVVEGCDDEWTFIPPSRSAMLAEGRLPRASIEFRLECLGKVTVWELRRGSTEIHKR